MVWVKLAGLSAYEHLELRAFDAFIQHRPQPPARTDLVHIDIDDQTIEQVGRWQDWSRTHHAHLVETLAQLEARAVAFDIEFPEPTVPRLGERTLTDRLLAPLQQQAQSLRAGIDDLLRQVRTRADPTVSPEEFEGVLNQIADLFSGTSQDLRSDLAAAVEDPDAVFAQALRRGDNVYLPYSLLPPERGPLPAAVVEQAVELLRRDFTMTRADLGRALDLSRERDGVSDLFDSQRLYINHLREQAALLEAESLLATDDQASAEELRSRLLGSSSTSAALERTVDRAYDRARGLRLLLGQSRTRMPEQGAGDSPAGERAMPPVSVMAEAAAGQGVVNALPDLDGKVRRAYLFWQFRGHLLPHLSLVVLSDLLEVPLESVLMEPGVSVTFPAARVPGEQRPRTVSIPVDERGAALINWALAPRAVRNKKPYSDTFPHVSAATILELWDINEVLERTYLALDEYTGGRQAQLLAQLKEVEEAGEDDAQAEKVRAELAQVRRGLREFLARQVTNAQARIQAATDEAERTDLEEALRPLHQDLRLLRRRESRRGELLDHLTPIISGSTCIVGTTFTAGTDFHPVPFHTHLPGACAYSHLLNMVLEGCFLRRASTVVAVAAILVCGLVVGLLSASLRASKSGVLTLGVVAAYVGFSYWCFTRWGVWLDTVGPAVTPLLAFSLVTAYRQLTEERQKRWIRNVFQHYLSPDVVTEVLEQPDLLGLRGRIQEVTVFFSDLADFTSIAEGLPPEELTQLLNDYLTPMTNIIQAHGGCLDKYEGDLIMSFFGAPVQHPDHARRGCFAALENQARLAELREQFRREGRPILHVRIGLASGAVRVGNMGSEMRFDYTVMGDYTNLASRLEGANKFYGTGILISESTWRAAGAAIHARELDLIRVKGRAEPVRIYELLAKAGELDDSWKPVLKTFPEGLRLYRERHWEEAAGCFQKVLDLRPEDGPSAVLRERCREFLVHPPPEDWAGVFTAGGK